LLIVQVITPAAEGHGLCPWMNAPAFGRDVAPLGREDGATGYAREAPHNKSRNNRAVPGEPISSSPDVVKLFKKEGFYLSTWSIS
jgi:hypothetical protein